MSGTPTGDSTYPGKSGLSKYEVEQVRAHGPAPSWFEPWATRVVMFPDVVDEPYGVIHLHAEASDVFTWPTRDGLSRGLDALYRAHTKCHQCQGVLYFTADVPRLRLVADPSDSDDEGSDQ